MKSKVFLFVLGCQKGNPEYIISNKVPTKKWEYNGYWHFGDSNKWGDSEVMDMETARLLGADRIPSGKIRAYWLKAFSPAFDVIEEPARKGG